MPDGQDPAAIARTIIDAYLYMSAVAQELDGSDVTDEIELFSQRSRRHGGRPFTTSDVRDPSRLRLYRATALDHYILEAEVDRRIQVAP